MEIRKIFQDIEKFLAEFRLVIGVLVLVMLITVAILTWQNFDKQNQIIETGGFTDGKIKCVCNQEVYDVFDSKKNGVDLSGLTVENG